MTSMDRDVVDMLFRLLDAAVTHNECAYTDVTASSPDGIAEVTLLAVPSYLAHRWIKSIEDIAVVRKLKREA
jgi:hypothetical protein